MGLAVAGLAVAAAAVALVAFGLAAIKPGTAVETAIERLAPAGAATDPAAEEAAPPVEAAAAESTAPSPPAQLHVVYNNRLATGTMTVWVDGERAWSGPVSAPRNLIKRVAGREVRQTLAIAPGERTVEVRVSGRAAKLRVDAADRIRGRFEAGATRWLRVTVNPLTDSLGLTWME